MKKNAVLTIAIVVLILLAFSHKNETPVLDFLNSLNQTQKEKVQFPFEHDSKTFWHYLPTASTPRSGIQLKDLDTKQKKLFNTLLKSFLSESGYSKTQRIIDLENILLEASGDSIRRDPEQYFIAFYGNPVNDSLWAWSFEGHHVSLNFTISNGTIHTAPRFFGANPATISFGERKGERTLKEEDDLGLELVNSLTTEQKKVAIFQKSSPYDIFTINTSKLDPLNPVGIMFKELNDNQQMTFLKLLNVYLSSLPTEQFNKRMAQIQDEDFDSIRFGWAGGSTLGVGHYYRVQGKSFLIEFDKTQDNANHIHTVWRDFEGDFGRDIIKEHYKNSSHHKH